MEWYWTLHIEGGGDWDLRENCYLVSEGDTGKRDPPNVDQDGGVGPVDPNKPCLTMSRMAQQAADDALRVAGDNLNAAVERFDAIFNGMWYAGERVTSLSDASHLREHGFAGRGLAQNYFGEADFRQEFKEADRNGNLVPGDPDQMHHFSAYLSAGINSYAVGALRVGQWVHRNLDNAGDNRLGSAAFTLRRELSANPNMLRNIGEIIRNRICSP